MEDCCLVSQAVHVVANFPHQRHFTLFRHHFTIPSQEKLSAREDVELERKHQKFQADLQEAQLERTGGDQDDSILLLLLGGILALTWILQFCSK